MPCIMSISNFSCVDDIKKLDFNVFEANELQAFGAPAGTGLRHRSCHFQRMLLRRGNEYPIDHKNNF